MRVAETMLGASRGTILNYAAEICGAKRSQTSYLQVLLWFRNEHPWRWVYYLSDYYPSTSSLIQLQLKSVKQLASLSDDSLAKNTIKVAIQISKRENYPGFEKQRKHSKIYRFSGGSFGASYTVGHEKNTWAL